MRSVRHCSSRPKGVTVCAMNERQPRRVGKEPCPTNRVDRTRRQRVLQDSESALKGLRRDVRQKAPSKREQGPRAANLTRGLRDVITSNGIPVKVIPKRPLELSTLDGPNATTSIAAGTPYYLLDVNMNEDEVLIGKFPDKNAPLGWAPRDALYRIDSRTIVLGPDGIIMGYVLKSTSTVTTIVTSKGDAETVKTADVQDRFRDAYDTFEITAMFTWVTALDAQQGKPDPDRLGNLRRNLETFLSIDSDLLDTADLAQKFRQTNAGDNKLLQDSAYRRIIEDLVTRTNKWLSIPPEQRSADDNYYYLPHSPLSK